MLVKISIKLRLLFESLYRVFYYFTIGLFYKKNHYSNYISFSSSIRKKLAIELGRKVRINRNVNIWCFDIKIGNNVGIGSGSNLFGKVTIGNNIMIAPNVAVMGGGHGIAKNGVPMKNQKPVDKGGIVIEDDVWIGANAVILDGVCIKKGCVIGAGSVLTKSTEEYGIYGGIPAKLLKYRE